MREKVVFDTNILLSATLWEGSEAQKLLHKLIMKDCAIYSTPEILEEYKKVLKRDFDYSDEEVARIMEKITGFITIVIPDMKVDVVENDPDDNKIIECALESESEYIITYDQHLLKIKEYERIKIIKPEYAIKIF